MSDKLTTHQFDVLREALETDARTLVTRIEAAIEASLEGFEALERAKQEEGETLRVHNMRAEALRCSKFHKVLVGVFCVRFPLAAEDMGYSI